MILGKPQAMKQVNLSAVRKVIMDKGSATRLEIVEETKISVTTVRALLIEMQKMGEIIETGYDVSSGGRKAARYQMSKDKYYGVSICITGEEMRWFILNICGEMCDSGILGANVSDIESIFSLLDDLTKQYTIKSIGIGVPGIPDDMDFLRKNSGNELERFSIGRLIHERYGISVVLENDLNAIAYGFARCYLNQFPEELSGNTHMAYLHFEKGCLSAGFISNGQIIRGWNNYSGELGMFPMDEDTKLDDVLDAPLSDMEYAQAVAKVISAICCILNPQYIALGGSNFRKSCLPLIGECYQYTLPPKMTAELLYADDVWHDYFEGMAAITAEHFFSDVYLVKR